MGLTPLILFTVALLIVRNQRILHAWNARQEETQRRAAAGLPPQPQTAPQDPRRPRRRATLTRNRHDHKPRAVTTSQDSRHNQARARPGTGQTTEPGPAARPKTPAPDHGLPGGRNVRPKRENKPH